uniref:Uncharacterized protein n=1 Tax=Cacopsylla melanoneura TaxID=428564 RepID=A0A8D8SY21_9HEMI
MSNPVFDSLPRYPDDEQIVEDLTGVQTEDPLFSSEVKLIIDQEETIDSQKKSEDIPTDFDKIKQLVLTNQNLREFLTEVEDKFKTNIDARESEIKLLANELKHLNEKVKI